MEQRIHYIDCIKAFSISLIIISHCIGWWPVNDLINKAILSIHVPIFFIAVGVLKGYLLKEETLCGFIKKRARQLLIPYFWFSIYNCIVKLSMMALGVGGTITMNTIKNEAIDFLITGNGTVWFLMTLFLAESLFVYVNSLKQTWITIFITLILAFIPFLLNNNNPILIVINRFMSAFFYIVVGFYAAYFLKNRKISAACSMPLLLLWLYLVYNTTWDYSFFNGHFSNILFTVPTVLCGSLGFISLFSLISRSIPTIEYVGRNSLILMLVHPTFLLIGVYGVYAYLAKPFLHANWHYALFSIVLIFFVYGISLLCVPFINKYMPFVIGKKRYNSKTRDNVIN